MNRDKTMAHKWMMLRLESSLKGAVANENQDMMRGPANDNPSLDHFSGQELVACRRALDEQAELLFARSALLVKQAEGVAKRFGVDLDKGEPVR